MAQLLLTVGGQAIGYTIGGPIGAAIGGAIGSYAYSALFSPKPTDQVGPRFDDGRITSSAYGGLIPLLWGTMPAAGNIIDASTITAVGTTTGGDSAKGGPKTPKVTTFSHYADIDVLVAEGPVNALLQIYANERLIYDATENAAVTQPAWLRFDFYAGTESQNPDPTFEAIRGAGNVPAYRGLCHVVFRRFKLDEFGLSDQIAVQFRFVVSRDGSNAPTESTIDSTDVESTATIIKAINWSRTFDLMLVGLGTSAGTSSPTHTLFAVNPYTRDVIWKREYVDGSEEAILSNLCACSIPRYEYGIQVNAPGEQCAYTLTHGGTSTESLEISDADTGIVRIHHVLTDSYPPHWLIAPNERFLDLYRGQQTGTGAITVHRMANGGATWTDASVTAPNGWRFYADVIPATDGEGVVCFALEDIASGPPALFTVEDNIYIGETGSITFYDAEVTVLSGASIIKSITYDDSQLCFWVLALQSGGSHMDLIKISTDGETVDTWDLNADLGISGSVSFTDIGPAIDQISGRFIFAGNSNFYLINTADPETELKTYSMPTSVQSEGEYHPYTGRLYTYGVTSNDHILHIVKLGTAAAGTENLKTVVDAIETYGDTHITASDIDNTDLEPYTVNGFAISRPGMSRRAALDMLMNAYLFDIVPRDGVLTAVVRGSGSSAITLDEDTIGAHISGSDPVEALTIQKTSPEQLPHKLTITYINPNQNWESGAQMAQRLASLPGVGTEENIGLTISMTDEQAAQLADVLLHMRHIEAESYELASMPSTLEDVAPANIVTVAYEGHTYVGRVDRADIVEGMIVSAKLARADSSIYMSYAEGGSVRNPTSVVYTTGAAMLVPLQIPAVRDTDFDAGYYAAVYTYTPNWPGGQVFRSTDDSSYAAVGDVLQGAVVGTVASITGSLRALVYDTQSVIKLNIVTDSTLESESLSDIEASESLNAFAIGASGRWVIGRYLTATQIDGSVWALSGIVLGLQGTERHVESLTTYDKFILIDDVSVVRIALPTTVIGGVDYLKAATIGRNVNDVVPALLSPTGQSLKPFAPDGLHATGFGGDITLSWDRRDKKWTRNFWIAPQTESSESYTIDILDSELSVLRTLTSSSESVSYTSAQQANDFGASINYVRWRVAQVSASVGAGAYAYGASGGIVSWENTILSYSPLLFLRLNDEPAQTTAIDSSAYGNDGTVSGTSYSAFGIDGAFDTGFDFSTAGSFSETINCGNDSSLLNAATSDFSLGLWLNVAPSSLTTNDVGQIINQGATGIDCYFYYSGGAYGFYCTVHKATVDSRTSTEDFVFTPGEWQFFVFTYNTSTSTGKIYVDGVEVGSYDNQTTGTGAIVAATEDTVIGSTPSKQSIDELFIVPTELSSAQIAALYAKLTE